MTFVPLERPDSRGHINGRELELQNGWFVTVDIWSEEVRVKPRLHVRRPGQSRGSPEKLVAEFKNLAMANLFLEAMTARSESRETR